MRGSPLFNVTCIAINISVITLILAGITSNPILLGIAIGSAVVSVGLSVMVALQRT
jgi:hypothetical protein